jgi:predicted SprT family Zn-dependent metalloprotease
MDKRKEIIERLEGKTNLEILYSDYIEIESNIKEELQELKQYGETCECKKSPKQIRIIDNGEISTYCVKCGGMIFYAY